MSDHWSLTHQILHGRVAICRVLPCTAVSRLNQWLLEMSDCPSRVDEWPFPWRERKGSMMCWPNAFVANMSSILAEEVEYRTRRTFPPSSISTLNPSQSAHASIKRIDEQAPSVLSKWSISCLWWKSDEKGLLTATSISISAKLVW